MTTNDYYVYIYMDPATSEPFYVGKGKGYRSSQHLNPSGLKGSTHKINKIKKLLNEGTPPVVKLYAEHLTEQEAFVLEMALILQYGRKDLGTGPLLNHTNGGEGTSGRKRTPEEINDMRQRGKQRGGPWSTMTEEQREHTRQRNRELTRQRNKNNNPAKDPAVRAKMSAVRKGRPGTMKGKHHSPETIVKLKKLAQNRPKIKCEYCGKECTPPNHKQFHGQNCSRNPSIDPSILAQRAQIMLEKSEKARKKRAGDLSNTAPSNQDN